jgi:hypothetical protein
VHSISACATACSVPALYVYGLWSLDDLNLDGRWICDPKDRTECLVIHVPDFVAFTGPAARQ